jgi:hypothetical protein
MFTNVADLEAHSASHTTFKIQNFTGQRVATRLRVPQIPSSPLARFSMTPQEEHLVSAPEQLLGFTGEPPFLLSCFLRISDT